MESAFGVEHGVLVLKKYERLSPGDSYEPVHRQTTFINSEGKKQNVDRKMKRTVETLNRYGYRTRYSDQGSFRIKNKAKDAYVSMDYPRKGKKLQQHTPKRFEWEHDKRAMGGNKHPHSVVRFRSGPVIGAVNRRALRRGAKESVNA